MVFIEPYSYFTDLSLINIVTIGIQCKNLKYTLKNKFSIKTA